MDIIEYLEDNGIEVKTSGKNVSPGWIAIKCLFCDDPSEHLGIRINDLKSNCWRCGNHSISKIIKQIENCTSWEARQRINDLKKDIEYQEQELIISQGFHIDPNKIVKIETIEKGFPKIYRDYLKSRNFKPNLLRRKYNLIAGGNIGRYKFRIIIPIYEQRRLVSFTSRTIIKTEPKKYLNPQPGEYAISPKQCIYNIDSVKKDCLLTEGPADVWRFGNGAVAIIGLAFTRRQIIILKEKKIRNLFIMMDSERQAQIVAEDIYRLLRPYVKNAEIVESNHKKDLGDFTRKEAKKLREILHFDK